MSQAPITIDCAQTGSEVSVDLNAALASIDTMHSGSASPTTELNNGKFWLDTSGTNPVVKVYWNSTWEIILTYNGSDFLPNGSSISVFTGATGTVAGSTGIVPAPGATENVEFLRGDGTWAVPTNTNTQRPISSNPTDGATTTSISSDWAFDNVKTSVPTGALFTDNNTTYSNFSGTTAGLVPTSTATDDTKFLRADGNWVVPTDTNTQLTSVPGSLLDSATAGNGKGKRTVQTQATALPGSPADGDIVYGY